MKNKIIHQHLATKKLFDVVIDTNRLYCETIEEDNLGNILLHKSYTINMSSGYGTEDEYSYLTQEEYEEYKRKAKKKKR